MKKLSTGKIIRDCGECPNRIFEEYPIGNNDFGWDLFCLKTGKEIKNLDKINDDCPLNDARRKNEKNSSL